MCCSTLITNTPPAPCGWFWQNSIRAACIAVAQALQALPAFPKCVTNPSFLLTTDACIPLPMLLVVSQCAWHALLSGKSFGRLCTYIPLPLCVRHLVFSLTKLIISCTSVVYAFPCPCCRLKFYGMQCYLAHRLQVLSPSSPMRGMAA